MALGPVARKQLRSLGDVASIGIEMAVSISIGFFGGRWLDDHFGTKWIQWVGLALGIITGYRSLFRLVRKTKRDLAKPTDERPDDSTKP
jgi:uncharacterized membrane protein YfcA